MANIYPCGAYLKSDKWTCYLNVGHPGPHRALNEMNAVPAMLVWPYEPPEPDDPDAKDPLEALAEQFAGFRRIKEAFDRHFPEPW